MNTPGIIRITEQSIEQDRLIRLRGMINSSGGDPSSILEILHLVISSKDWRKMNDPKDKYGGSMTVKSYIESLGWTKDELFSFVSKNKHRHEKPPFSDPGRIAQMDELRSMVRQMMGETAEPLAALGENQYSEKSGCSNRTPSRGEGQSTYLTARIARDRPDILDRMKDGEFKSIRQAALAAGIVEPSFQCPADPVKASRRILRHFQGDALITLASELANHAGYDLVPKE